MTILDLAAVLNLTIVISSHPKAGWGARFDPSPELMRGAASLVGFGGSGTSPNAALISLANEIRGKRVVFNAMDPEHRREHQIPDNLESGLDPLKSRAPIADEK